MSPNYEDRTFSAEIFKALMPPRPGHLPASGEGGEMLCAPRTLGDLTQAAALAGHPLRYQKHYHKHLGKIASHFPFNSYFLG